MAKIICSARPEVPFEVFLLAVTDDKRRYLAYDPDLILPSEIPWNEIKGLSLCRWKAEVDLGSDRTRSSLRSSSPRFRRQGFRGADIR